MKIRSLHFVRRRFVFIYLRGSALKRLVYFLYVARLFLQGLAGAQARRSIAHPWSKLVVDMQLAGIMMFYLCLPGFSDTAAWAVIPTVPISGEWADGLSKLALFVFLPASIFLSVAACVLLPIAHVKTRPY